MIGDLLQPTHLIFLLLVALLVLGPKRLPEAGRSLGKGLRDFRNAMAGIEAEASGFLHHDESVAEPPLVKEPEPVPIQASSPVATSAPAVSAPTLVSSRSREPLPDRSDEPHPDDYAD